MFVGFLIYLFLVCTVLTVLLLGSVIDKDVPGTGHADYVYSL